ncbi:aminopeptidase P family protein [Fulvimarina sp. 2208YS6-2-32]|uniref:Aminopeptidase P family protein n=1 Tax=Fulvimarina uroteuthidis TaxID=3098149 RepID=A0ABU5HYK6_9HYPH|nr:aminopeptidase P family protein [Fulvimarina sp. 2208YS6-2-32]MDY8108197.1 aminopeptidase P family protein [Fulvimarina sp. 2208YS6-2-32]
MFQNFDDVSDSSTSASRVADLRERLKAFDIDGMVIPRADRHQNEYIPESEARLEWLSAFTGSAGTAVVLPHKAAVLSDGRYTIQLREQIDIAVFDPVSSVETSLGDYLSEHGKGLTIGIDPWLVTISGVKRLKDALEARGGKLVMLADNPIDLAWTDRPTASAPAVRLQPIEFAGRQAADKIAEIARAVEAAGCDLTVLTDPASVSWLFNIRGNDVAHTPLVLSFATVSKTGEAVLFVDPRKLGDEVKAALEAVARIAPYEDFTQGLRALAAGAKTGLDKDLAVAAIEEIVREAGGTVMAMDDPVRLPRARKNEAEIAGSRAAHKRDGAAMVACLAWLDRQAPGSVSEIEVAEALEQSRIRFGEADGEALQDISFDTIAGAGPHGAIVHYRVNRASNRTLCDGELFLLDSGGQYRDGTTDITRTIAIGEPVADMRAMFTRVLKGMIGISLARFPKGTRGVDLDVLARIALWKAGVDYAHGTGHGVGAFLAVHEGPQTLSRRGMTAFEPGMIVSNEPGYYKEGAYGIRIENLVLVTRESDIEGGETSMMGFETLTLCPIDRRLIDPGLMTAEEITWLDAYHAQVRGALTPMLDVDEAAWLAEATRPLAS